MIHGHTDKHSDRYVGRHIDKQIGRQADRQTVTPDILYRNPVGRTHGQTDM